MPHEKKKRGRRDEAKLKRKREEALQTPSKPFKSDRTQEEDPTSEITVTGDVGDNFIGLSVEPPKGVQAPREEDQFHGFLDPEEQEYYAKVNSKIVSNDFESDEDRANFVAAVHRETEGKELRVASSQSCSRYLEKIILLSTPGQLRNLFSKFLGNLTYLVRHRFGSHCCETLFLEAAKYVGKEIQPTSDDEESLPLMEDLFLQASEELEPNMGYLLTERFASHTVRVLFLVLSGEPLDDVTVKSLLASKRKEKLDPPLGNEAEPSISRRAVPKSFDPILSKLANSAISSLDTTYLRALTTHPTGNPVLQLLLQLELSKTRKNKQSDESSLLRKLLPDEELEADSESAKFIGGLIYDPTGSHLVEILVQSLPGKAFKKLYKNVLKSRLSSLAKNDTASYVGIRLLERLGKDDLAEAKGLILPELPGLISRRRTGLVKVLIERCSLRQVDLHDVSDVVKAEYGGDKKTFLLNLLNFKPRDQQSQSEDKPEDVTKSSRLGTDVHASLLAQAMLGAPIICSLVQDSLLALDTTPLVGMAQDPASSRVIQSALSPTNSNLQFRRVFIPRFYGHIASLAQDVAGSYVADALWEATSGLHFVKEKLARELASNEARLRESFYGRNVWKNWAMDLHQRRPGEWRALAKGQVQEQEDKGKSKSGGHSQKTQKSAIQLARERYAQRNLQAGKDGGGATSANAVVPTNA